MLYTSPWSRFQLTPSVVIGTDCIDDDHDGPFKVLDRVYKTIYPVWNLTYFYILVHSLGKLNYMESDWTEDKI